MMRAIAAAVLLAALAGCGMNPAYAQTPRRPQVTGDLMADAKANLGITRGQSANPVENAFDQLHAGLQKVAKDAADSAVADLTAALKDAQLRSDAISQPCWQAQLDFIKLLPVEWDTPPGEIGLALGMQIKRDLLNALTGAQVGSIKVACAALLGDEMKIFVQIGALFGLRIATGGAL